MSMHAVLPALPRDLASFRALRSVLSYALLAIAICATSIPATADGLTASAYGLDFPITNVGQQSLPRTAVVTNTGSTALPISVALTASNQTLPPEAQFFQTNDCGTILAGGARCTVSVIFKPTRVTSIPFSYTFLTFGPFNSGPAIYLNGTARALSNANISITVDEPPSGGAILGRIRASGWAIANNDSVTGVTYQIDNFPGFNYATYGYKRTDVCQVYPGRYGCPYVGWEFDLDTNNLTVGSHVLNIRANTQLSGSKIISVPFTYSSKVATFGQMLQVDFPASGATLSGTVTLYGWALRIPNVEILIDGVPFLITSLLQPRADVCAVYPYQSPCPGNPGWSYILDTTQLADGPPTLTFLNPTRSFFPGSSSNLAVDVPVTVANFATAQSNPMKLTIDTPNARTGTLSGLATLSGWAIADNASISNVLVAVDGRNQGPAFYGVSRLDVCVVYPNRAGCPSVGWSYALDTTLLADGAHRLALTARSSGGTYTTVESQFTVSNASTSSPFHAYIDYPTATSVVSGTPAISGWALHDNARVSLVTISVDGVPDGFTTDSIARPDVCAVYPGRANCPNTGWKYSLNTLKFADGRHTLDITLTSGSQHSTFSTIFTTTNFAPGNATLLYVDQPNAASGPLSGVTTIAGWVVDDRVSGTIVSTKIDGIPLGGTFAYNLPRQDVCNVYPGRIGCPNVGWSVLLDTTGLADGPHTLTVTTSGSTTVQSVSTKINVANGNSATPSARAYIDQPIANGPTLQGATRISGWAINTLGNFSFTVVYVDGVSLANSPSTEPRPDVCAVYTTAKNCSNAGWYVDLDTAQFVDGPHTLQVLSAGAIASVPIVIGNSIALNPMHLTIDGSATGNLSGTVNLWGWAVSDDAAISTVAVSIDGASFGNAGYGDNRNDVCAIYQNRLGCPNVGWHLSVDTTKLSNGSHTVLITATSGLGEQATQTVTITVKN
jgi:hypothetical protein